MTDLGEARVRIFLCLVTHYPPVEILMEADFRTGAQLFFLQNKCLTECFSSESLRDLF